MEQKTFTTLKNETNNIKWINEFKYPNETFSGCDMTVALNMKVGITEESGKTTYKLISKILPEVQTVSYSIHMEKRPVRSIGNVNAKDYTMGPRTVAGSLVLSVFNKHFAKKILADVNQEFAGSNNFLVDELPPFDLIISAANEYGFRSRLVIYGVRLLSEGQVMSINDVYTENTYQFFATDVEYLNDEQKYSYNKTSKWYVLGDDIKWEPSEKTPIPSKNIYNSFYDPTSSWYEDRQKYLSEKIFLSVTVKQPFKPDSNGIATFILAKVETNTTGVIEVKDQNGASFNISVSHAAGENGRRVSKSLAPGKYTAIYKEISNGETKARESNTEVFYVNSVKKTDPLAKWAPTVEWISEKEMSVFSNEPLHDTVCIESVHGVMQSKLINKRHVFKNLQPSTDYKVFTTNSEEGNPSSKTLVRTFDIGHKMFLEFEKFVISNSSKLVNSYTKDYIDLIEEARVINISKDQSNVEPSLIEVRDKYKKDLDKLLDSNNATETLINEIKGKIKMLGELLFLSVKLTNNVVTSINSEFLLSPELFYNDKLDTCIEFNKETSHAEFFRDYGNHTQFDDRVYNYMFKVLESRKNSFRFLGKQGVFHHVDAYNKHIKAPTLKFYIPTQEEKFDLINKNNNAVNKEKQEYIESSISNHFKNISDEQYHRLFINKLKEKLDSQIESPFIKEVNENIIINTAIFKMQSSLENIEYNLCIANKQEILNDQMIYKVPFSNKDEEIVITKIFNGLKVNEFYSMWIEDMSGMQISSPTSLRYVPHRTVEDLKHMENQELFKSIKKICSRLLPGSLYENIESLLEFDDTVNILNLTEKIMEQVLSSSITREQLEEFLKSFKFFIGPNITSNSPLIERVDNKNNNEIIFEGLVNDITVVYVNTAVTRNTRTWNEKLDINSQIKVDELPDGLTYFYAVSKDLKKKSKLVFVNKFKNYVEVV